jgi:hypothetical protein
VQAAAEVVELLVCPMVEMVEMADWVVAVAVVDQELSTLPQEPEERVETVALAS